MTNELIINSPLLKKAFEDCTGLSDYNEWLVATLLEVIVADGTSTPFRVGLNVEACKKVLGDTAYEAYCEWAHNRQNESGIPLAQDAATRFKKIVGLEPLALKTFILTEQEKLNQT